MNLQASRALRPVNKYLDRHNPSTFAPPAPGRKPRHRLLSFPPSTINNPPPAANLGVAHPSPPQKLPIRRALGSRPFPV